MSTGLFDNIDDAEDDLFKDTSHQPENGEKTPEYFNKVDPSGEMNLFSPTKPKDSLFDFDDNDDSNQTNEEGNGLFSLDDQNEDVNNEDESKQEEEQKEEPLGFLNNEDETDKGFEVKEDFELIESTEVPSVEEAERQLEIVRQETERRKKEEERLRFEEEPVNNNNEEEVTDGAAFSRVFGGSTTMTTPPPTADDEDPLTFSDEIENKSSNDDETEKVLETYQQQLVELTSKLQSAQSENGSLKSEVSVLQQQLEEERAKNVNLSEMIKKKDAEITALKEATTKPPSGKPSPSLKRPSLTTKPSSVTSPRGSARLKQDTEKKSVAETAKRFSQPETKKPSPSLKRATRKDSTESSRIPRQDSSSSRKKDQSDGVSVGSTADKKPSSSSSPTKPSRTKTRSGSQSESPMISHKPQRNTLDAIKIWEQKTGDKKETSPPAIKKSVKSTPNLVPSEGQENGEENLPPAEETTTTTATDPDKDKTEEEATKSPLKTRGRKTESMIVSGSKSKRWTPPTVDKCQVCKKTVYPLERLQADEKVYHKTCFRCTHCKKVVGLGTYAAIQGEIYCKTHFKMLFRMKGNYDEGFGREQHKKKWSKDSSATAEN